MASVQSTLTGYCSRYDPGTVDDVAVFVEDQLSATCDPHVRVHELKRAERVVQEGVTCVLFVLFCFLLSLSDSDGRVFLHLFSPPSFLLSNSKKPSSKECEISTPCWSLPNKPGLSSCFARATYWDYFLQNASPHPPPPTKAAHLTSTFELLTEIFRPRMALVDSYF